jgi:hypothetical protein
MKLKRRVGNLRVVSEFTRRNRLMRRILGVDFQVTRRKRVLTTVTRRNRVLTTVTRRKRVLTNLTRKKRVLTKNLCVNRPKNTVDSCMLYYSRPSYA